MPTQFQISLGRSQWTSSAACAKLSCNEATSVACHGMTKGIQRARDGSVMINYTYLIPIFVAIGRMVCYCFTYR